MIINEENLHTRIWNKRCNKKNLDELKFFKMSRISLVDDCPCLVCSHSYFCWIEVGSAFCMIELGLKNLYTAAISGVTQS